MLEPDEPLLGHIVNLLLEFADLEVFFSELLGQHEDEFVVAGVCLAQRCQSVGALRCRGVVVRCAEGLVVQLQRCRIIRRGRRLVYGLEGRQLGCILGSGVADLIIVAQSVLLRLDRQIV